MGRYYTLIVSGMFMIGTSMMGYAVMRWPSQLWQIATTFI